MTNSTINPFIVPEEGDPLVALGIIARFMRTSDEANESIAKWMFKSALPFNDPVAGVVMADKWTSQLNTQITLFLSQSLTLVGFKCDEVMFRLTGNSKFANYYKRIDGAMRNGGDLVVLGSVSACEKFRKEALAKIKTDGEAAVKRDQLKVLATREGLVEGTPEFDKYVSDGMGNQVAAVPQIPVIDGGTAALTEPKDEWDEWAIKAAAEARAFASEVSLTQARQMCASLMDRFKSGIAQRLAIKAAKTG